MARGLACDWSPKRRVRLKGAGEYGLAVCVIACEGDWVFKERGRWRNVAWWERSKSARLFPQKSVAAAFCSESFLKRSNVRHVRADALAYQLLSCFFYASILTAAALSGRRLFNALLKRGRRLLLAAGIPVASQRGVRLRGLSPGWLLCPYASEGGGVGPEGRTM